MHKKTQNAKDRIRGSEHMIKKIAWETFKNTGDLNTFLEYKQLQEIEQQLKKVDEDGNNKIKWDNNF